MNSDNPRISEELGSAPALSSNIRFFKSELRILPGTSGAWRRFAATAGPGCDIVKDH